MCKIEKIKNSIKFKEKKVKSFVTYCNIVLCVRKIVNRLKGRVINSTGT